MDMVPLAGGWSGRTFLSEDSDEPVVVRLFPPEEDPDRIRAHAAVLRLVNGLVPVPGVLDIVFGDPAAGRPGMLMTEFVAGRRADLVLPTLDDDDLGLVARRLVEVAADLAGMPFLSAGTFIGPELHLEEFRGPEGRPLTDLADWVDLHAHVFGTWSRQERVGLADVADRAQDLLDASGRIALAHSDFNPKNLLLDDNLGIAAVVDWEYAHAGHPFTDLGNLLRFERAPGFAEPALRCWCERRGGTPQQALETARAADLWALIDLAGRVDRHPIVERATGLLRAIAGSRDLHASPPS